jgi:deoxyribodipyrimidine photo-lyase
MSSKKEMTIFWFRRDLRLQDNAGLYHALKENKNVLPLFIFDTSILEQLENKQDRRVIFIWEALQKMQNELEELDSSLFIVHDKPLHAFETLTATYSIKNVYTNHDYEPAAIQRDNSIQQFLEQKGIALKTYKDQVIFEKNEITKDNGLPYTIFTPYMRKWKTTLSDFYLKAYPTDNYFSNFFPTKPFPFPSLKTIGFEPMTEERLHFPDGVHRSFPEAKVDREKIAIYDQQRDYPAISGTTHLGVHLRFGTLSIRQLATVAKELNETWLNELIWREFYMAILFHFPHVATGAFKKQYDNIAWRNNEKEFEAWCNGNTGYPIVDAGMRELNTTGFMHNRVRMIVASFLVKHLLIDWRWGETYFAQKLLDYDLAANNGGWQWAASSGCDAAPYFRIFNPYEQTKRFDPKQEYIRKWVPEFEDVTYPKPIVEHKFARERVLAVYKKALGNFQSS